MRKILFILLLVFLFGLANSVQAADLGYIGNFSLNGILGILDGVGYLIGYIASLFVNIGGTLVNWSLDLNSQIINSSTVKIGWVVSRDLANLGFVLTIILISFATILRLEAYQLQKLLSKLIIAALLVNFSLVIAGILIDSSGILTNFFINKATSSSPSTIGAGLADAFQVQKLLWPTDTENAIKNMVQGLATDPNAHIPFTASVIFVAIFTIIIAISLVSLAAMLFIRYMWLTMLLILMPIVWLLWIWPDLENNWKSWWSKFMQWTFFAPAMTFFIYLALNIVTPEHKDSILKAGFEAPPGITLKDFPGLLGRMLSVLGILYGGMYTANSMGIAGANAGFAVAKGFKNIAIGGALIGGGYAAGGIRDRIRNFGADKEGKGIIQRYSAQLTGNPLIGGIARGVNEWATAGKKEQVGAYEKEFEKLSEDKEALLNTANRPRISSALFANDAYAAAYINKVADKGWINDLKQKTPPELFERLVIASRKAGTSGKVFAKMPTLAAIGITDKEEANKAIKKAMAKAKPIDKANIDADAIYSETDFNPTILLNFTKPDIKQLSMLANGEQTKAINKGIKKIKEMLAAGTLKLDAEENAQEKRNFEYLQNWENDSVAGQLAKTEKSAETKS